jgi:chromosome segregation ATPase
LHNCNTALVSTDDASTQLATLVAQRDKANHRIEALADEQRAAGQARAEARAALVETERKGVPPTERRKLEDALTAAEARPSVLSARIEGARHGLRDADVEVARFVGENLRELVDGLEADARLVAEKINAAAEAIVAGLAEREAIASQISALASRVGRVHTGDVYRSAAEEVANAARKLLGQGGEVPPELRRDPREPRHAQAAAPAA